MALSPTTLAALQSLVASPASAPAKRGPGRPRKVDAQTDLANLLAAARAENARLLAMATTATPSAAPETAKAKRAVSVRVGPRGFCIIGQHAHTLAEIVAACQAAGIR